MSIVPLSGEFAVAALSGDSGDQPSVAGDGDGRFFISWTAVTPQALASGDGSSDILGRLFDLQGALTGDQIVNTERRDAQREPQAAGVPGGGFVIGYTSGEENQLEGIFASAQALAPSGARRGPETFSASSYYHGAVDLAAFPDGRYVVVSSAETDGEAQVRSADGASLASFHFGYNGYSVPAAVTALDADRLLVAFNGYAASGDDGPSGLHGLYVQTWTLEGVADAPRFIALTGSEDIDPSARRLADGHVVLTWQDGVGAQQRVLAAVVDAGGAVLTAPFVVQADGAGAPAAAALDTGDFVLAWTGSDGQGQGVLAQVFHPDGRPAGSAFVVNATTAGDQSTPSVAALGAGGFVVAWDAPSGAHARLFRETFADPSTSPLYARAGTLDVSAPLDQTLAGRAGPNSVYVDIDAASGHDRITGFQTRDVLLTSKPLVDANHDGVIGFGANALLNLDGPASAADTLSLPGVRALRYLGLDGGLSVYADATVRPAGALEGVLGPDSLAGDPQDRRGDVFFFDTALGAGLGSDRISAFGFRDLLVTTTAIRDGNHDGRIDFGSDGRLDLPGGSVQVTDVAGAQVGALQAAGTVTHDGVVYYLYALVGSSAGLSDLHF